MREFLNTLLLRIKLLCVAFGWVKDVTNQSKYYTKLKEYNIRLFASPRNMIYVVRNNKIILKSYKPRFEVMYNTWKEDFIFIINEKCTNKMFEVTRNLELEVFTDFANLYKIEKLPYIILTLRNNCLRNIIYNYADSKILFSSQYTITWLKKAKLFVVENGIEDYYLVAVKHENGKLYLEKMNFSLSEEPEDVCYPQLVGNTIILLTEGKASVLHKFDSIKEKGWLPAPYEYLARSGEELYMVGISDDSYMINVDADDIKPLAEEFTGLENFFVLKNGNNVAIVKYEDDQLVRLGAVDGTGIKIGTPFLDFSESAIKIPLKVTVEKNLTE